MHSIRCLAISLVLCISTLTRAEEPENPHVWQPRVKSVAVFKNGMGFFVREGSVTLRDGWCAAEKIPPATFGTFAIFASDKEQMVDVVGAGPGETVEFDGKDGPADAAGKKDRLLQTVGMKVALTCKVGDKTTAIGGTLVEVTDTLAVLRENDQLHAARLAEVTKMQVQEMPLRVHVNGVKDGTSPVSLGMAYLRKGVTWIPEYTLEIIDENTAELTLRGTLVNEAEDLINADVNFVVGVPNFAHAEYLTPIAIGQVLRTMAVASAIPSQVMSQALIGNNAMAARQNMAADGRAPLSPGNIDSVMSSLPAMEGAGASDYAVYTKRGLTVRCGEKAIVTIFRKRIPYSHFYRWTVGSDLRHFLVLSNEGDTPWTTGPAIAVSEQRPLCQDLIRYTPRGGRYELPITTAVNVATEQSESEVARKMKSHEVAHDVFLDLVTIDGVVRVKNFQDKAVRLAITRPVAGQVLTASDGGKITQDVTNLKLLERSGAIEWQIELAPGQSKELTYRYERYVPSR